MPILFDKPLIRGDSWSISLDSGAFSDVSWNAVLTFAAGTSKLSSTASRSTNLLTWAIPGSQTAALTPQPYRYSVTVGNGVDRYTLDCGGVMVSPDISAPGSNIANKTNLQLMLEACDATLLALLSQKTTMVQFAGQMYQMHEIDKLFAVRNTLAARVADEQEELIGNSRSRRIITTFVNR